MKAFSKAESVRILVERPGLSGVKGIMIGARFILLLLWPILFLAGSVHARGAAAGLAVGVPAQSQVGSASGGSSATFDFQGVHHRALVRVHRRADFRPVSTGSFGDSAFAQAEVLQRASLVELHAGYQAPAGLANGWQFLWRTAPIPRAPSLVS